jgi:phytoene dehydrogenase-like protein
MTRFDFIVVGGGIGGLSIAALLSHKKPGSKILLLERNSSVGGRLFSYDKEGFKLDIGAHAFSRSDKGPIGDILRIIGQQELVKFTYAQPMTSYQGKVFAFPKGLQGMVEDKDFDRLLSMWREMMNLTSSHVEELDNVNLCSYVHRFTDCTLVHACIDDMCNACVCVPYFKASAGEFIRCLQAQVRARSIGYPVGGCGSITNAITHGVREAGCTIETGTNVDRIIIEGSVAKGVVANGISYFADIVISNADIKHTMLGLVGEDQLDANYTRGIESLEYSKSALVIRAALDKVLVDWKLMTHIGSNDPVGYHRDLEEGKIPDNMNLFMPVPSNFAPDVAPPGKQLLVIATSVPFAFPDIDGLKHAMIDAAEGLIPNLRKHILWTDVTTPAIINKFAGENGAIVGIAQTTDQSGRNRPQMKTPIKNLYLCGAEAGGWGIGVELAIESSRSLAELISKDTQL